MPYPTQDTPNKPKRDIKTSIGLFLFGAAFFLATLSSFFGTLKPLALLDRARAWVETPAQILSLNLKHGTSDGDPTYTLEIDYQYEINGQSYTSDRFSTVLNSNSRTEQKNYNHYKPLFDAKQPITCWVNPAKPTEAIIDRMPHFEGSDLSMTLFFLPIFWLVGLGIMLFACIPSRADPEPNPRHIPDITPAFPLFVLVTLTIATLAYAVFIFSVLIHFPPWPWYLWLLLLLPLILTSLSIRRYIRGKLNGAYLDLSRPAAIGTALPVTLHLPCPLDGREQTVTLRCQRTYSSGSDSSTSTVWEDEFPATVFSDGATSTLSVHLAFPPGQHATIHSYAHPSYTWELRAKVKYLGLRHTLTFEIRVTPNPVAEPPVPLPRHDDFAVLAPLLKLKRFTFTAHAPDDVEIAFNASKAFYKILSALTPIVFVGVFIYCGHQSAKTQNHTPFAQFFFGHVILCAVVMFAVIPGLATLLAISRGVRCDITKRTFTVWRQIGAFPRKERVIAASYVAGFNAKVFATTDGGEPTHFTVQLQTLGGERHTVSKIINSEPNAQALTRFLNAQLQAMKECAK